MGHPAVDNRTQFAFEPLFLTDEEGRAIMAAVSKATFNIGRNHPILSFEQVTINLEGEYWGNPDFSSYKYEPETTFHKPGSDVVLVGSAYAQKTDTAEMGVGLQVDKMKKVVRVIGDRFWEKVLGVFTISDPEPFEKMPLVFELCFGGWDRSHIDPQKHTFEPRNPVGIGFRDKEGRFEEGTKLPNIEDPRHPIKNYGDTPPPAGFGFISPHWQPRASFAGTYDEAWQKERMPLLPKDFDRRFFNAAPQDQIAPGYLRGDESVVVTNASPGGRIAFNLPGVDPPKCRIEVRGNKKHELQTNLDTVIINTDENLLFLIWRTYLTLRNGPHDLMSIEVFSDSMPLKEMIE